MHRVVIAIVFILLPLNYGAYLPSLFWDTSNPILQKKFWHEVVQVKIYDTITFVCPNDIIKIRGSERMYTDGLYQNLYVKEVPADINNFDGACDTSENSTAIFIMNCDKPKKFNYQNIQINLNQAHPDLPKFKYGKDYMFFATSDGRRQSLTNNTSTNCTVVFRIHFGKKEEQIHSLSCPLFDRKNVCEDHSKQPKQEGFKECKDIMPQELNTTTKTGNNVIVSWQPPSNIACNITYYTVCYRENLTKPCREVLVPAKQHSVTLCKLAADQNYIVQVRAHTAKGPGDYCKKKNFETDGKKEPDILEQKDEQSTSIDGKSIAIGFVIGVFLTLVLVIAFWLFFSRIYKKKFKVDDENENEEDTIKNNPNFYKGDDEENGVITLNTGYRQSGQNWKLPAVQEENLHLYVSDA